MFLTDDGSYGKYESRNKMNYSLTYKAFCVWGVCLLRGGSQAGSWTPYFGHLRRSCAGSEFLEDYRMVLDPSTFQLGGNILCQDICGVVPT
jgi:hypothetical protein